MMPTRTVAIAIHDGVQALDVAGPVDVFHEANGYLPAQDRYETVLVAADRRPLRASNRMQMLADLAFDEAGAAFDIVLVAGGPALPDAEPDPRFIDWIRAAPQRAGIYGSICTGAFALGHAGLLDQRSEEHTSELQSLMRISYAVFCLKKKNTKK